MSKAVIKDPVVSAQIPIAMMRKIDQRRFKSSPPDSRSDVVRHALIYFFARPATIVNFTCKTCEK